jgi:hypothetical protein
MHLTIEVSEGPTDIRVGQAGTAYPLPSAGDVSAPESIPAGAIDAGADNASRAQKRTAAAASPRGGAGRAEGQEIPGAPVGAIPFTGLGIPAGEAQSAGPSPYETDQQRYSLGIAVDIVPGAGSVIS